MADVLIIKRFPATMAMNNRVNIHYIDRVSNSMCASSNPYYQRRVSCNRPSEKTHAVSTLGTVHVHMQYSALSRPTAMTTAASRQAAVHESPMHQSTTYTCTYRQIGRGLTTACSGFSNPTSRFRPRSMSPCHGAYHPCTPARADLHGRVFR